MTQQPNITPDQWKRLPLWARRRIRYLEEENERQRKALGRVWGYVLGGLLEEKFNGGESLLAYILKNDPVLRKRFWIALKLDELVITQFQQEL